MSLAATRRDKENLAEMYGLARKPGFQDQKNTLDHFVTGINHKSVTGSSIRCAKKRAYPQRSLLPPIGLNTEFMTIAPGHYFISRANLSKHIGRPPADISGHRTPGTVGKSPEIKARQCVLELILRFLGNQIDFDLETNRPFTAGRRTCEGKPVGVGKMTYHAVVLPELKTISPNP